MKAHPSQSYTLASRSKSRLTFQNLPKSMPAPTHGRQKRCSKLKEKIMENNEHQSLTHAKECSRLLLLAVPCFGCKSYRFDGRRFALTVNRPTP
jgi:hypothetical protein